VFLEKKTVSTIMLTLLLTSIIALAFKIQPVRASGTIYIRANGSIDPPTTPIFTADNITYTLADNINDSLIVVQRSNIVVDGNGCVVQGFPLTNISNVTIKNMIIVGGGVYINSASYVVLSGNIITRGGVVLELSSNNTITENIIILNTNWNVYLTESSGNTISQNYIGGIEGVGISQYGIEIYRSSNNMVIQNKVTQCVRAIRMEGVIPPGELQSDASNNTIIENNIEHYEWGISLYCSSNNTIVRNNITCLSDPWKGDSLGISLYCSLNNSIVKNNIEQNGAGVKLVDSSLNNITDNNLTENFYGILLEGSQVNSLIGNNITHSPMISEGSNETRRVGYGILISYTYYSNLLRNNSIAGYMYNFGMGNGYYFQDIDASNTVDGKPIYYWVNRESGQIPSDAGYVAIVNSTNIRVEGLDLKNNLQGIFIAYSNNLTVYQNNITENYDGIWLVASSNNTIYHNNFINNTSQVYIDHSINNTWDDGYPSGGNYWSDYVGVDVKSGPSQDLHGSDGIGDTPYIIDANNTDHYPLMSPYGAPPLPAYSLTITTTAGGTTDPAPETYTYTANSSVQVRAIPNADYVFDHWELDSINVGSSITYIVLMDKNHTLQAVFYIIGDINRDGTVDIKDLGLFVKAFGSYPTHTRWNPKADLNNDEKVDIKDLILLVKHFGEHYP